MVHPTLLVNNYYLLAPPNLTQDVAVGDGSDGGFDDTNYAQWSVGGDLSGNIIRLDTTAHPFLQLTHFTLDAGWTLQPVGTNPLIIESLSTVTVNGVIQCNGDDAAGSVAGAGRCGGKDGGAGGAANGGGANGVDADVTVTGGTGGGFQGGSYTGGGGGGSWSAASPAGNGANFGAFGGQAGASNSDPQFLTIAGGAGGGGGSGDAALPGGAGGGGGGVVIIHAVGNVDVGVAGYVKAGGGAGGDASGTGGPGGGGGGGSIQIFSGGEVTFDNTDVAGASQAPAGTGGTNTVAAIGASGSIGRSWVSTSTFTTNGSGTYSPIEEFPVNSGDVEFSGLTQYVITKSIDTGSNFGQIDSLSFSPPSSDFTFEVSGSNDNFVNDNTGWTVFPSAVSGKRYLKMKLSLTTSNVNLPTMIDSASIAFTPGSPDKFTFQSAGCGRVNGDGGSPWNFALLLVAPVMLVLLRVGKRKYTPQPK